MDALLVGTETFALMLILRLDYAPLIAVMVGATNIVPVLGPFLGAVPGVLLLLLESPLQAAEFLIIILAVQQIDGNFIAPRILGGATGLSGLGVLLAIVVGGELFGIVVNLTDYTVGADKGGAVNMFDDFDIDYNQQKYLIETRCSGALTVPFSAMAIEYKVA